MLKVAPQAVLCYNKPINIVARRCSNTPSRIRLDWRPIMNTLPLHALGGNPSKKCSKCKRMLPATSEYWHANKSNPDGFQYQCKQCRSKAQTKYIPPEGYKHCNRCDRDLPKTTEYFSYRGAYKGRKPRFSSQCRECKRSSDKIYTASHQEERKLYREEHQEERSSYRTKWRDEHLEHEKTYQKNYNKENSEWISERHKRYCDQYYQTERGRIQMRVSSNNRRSRKRNAHGSHTTEELYQQLHRQKNTCYYCHKKLGESRKAWVAEHIVPLSRGGSNSIDNIVIACPPCNLRKGSKLPHEWGDGGRLL